MAYRTKDQGTSVIDIEGTETQRLKNQAALQLLQAWRTDDAQEQAETWMVIKKALEEDRLSDRSLFQEHAGLRCQPRPWEGLSMADDTPTSPSALQQEIAAMEARLAELRRLADRERIAQSGAGGLAIGGTAGGEGSVVVGGDVYGHIYHVYQSAPGRMALRQEDVERILGDYLRWVYNAYSKARLYGLESSPTARGRPVRALAEVFVHVTLRRVQPPRRIEVEERARQMQGDAARAYLRLVEEKHQEGDTVPLQRLLTLHDRVAVIGGAGSGKSTLLAYLAASLAEAALQGHGAGVDLPPGKTTLVPLLIPLRYFREYVHWCTQAPQERVRQPRAGTLAGFIPWYLKRRNPALETSEDFFDRLLSVAAACSCWMAWTKS